MTRAAAVAAECRYCHQWEAAADDTYCGFCGSLLLLLEVEPPSQVLISTIAPVKELTLFNDGPRPMSVSIRSRNGAAVPGVVFEPEVMQIPPAGSVRVRVGVDDKKLPPGFHRVVEFVAVVDDDPRKQRPFKLDVRSGPSPKLLTTSLDFNDVEEGKTAQRSIEIANAGSVTLRIKGVRVEASPHLTIESDYADHTLRQNEKLSIPVTWHGSAGVEPADAGVAGIRVEFANHHEVFLVPARAQMYRYRLEAKPSSVKHKRALPKRTYATVIRLENSGTTDVEIISIESDPSWITVVSRATAFTLLSGDSAARKQLSPTTFARTFDFKIVCRPKDLAPGKHQGQVTVRAHGQEPLVIPVELTLEKPKDYSEYIGIDFGTTNSVVAILTSSGTLELVTDEISKKDLIPSVLVFDDTETYKIGESARREAPTAPERTVRSIKRVMGYERDRTFFDRSYSAGELASLIIAKLVQLAEDKLQKDATNGARYSIRKAIITVPANFHDLQIRDVLKACSEAGLEIEEARTKKAAETRRAMVGEAVNEGIILDEPAAAVLYYIDFLRRKRNATEIAKAIAREQGLRLLVFDYGGGTLDVAVASVTRVPGGGTGLRILANLGDNLIGGDYIDVLMMKELLKRCHDLIKPFDFDTSLIACPYNELDRRRESEGWSDVVHKEILRVRGAWKDIGEQAKIACSEVKQSPIVINPDLMVRMKGGSVESAQRLVSIDPLPASAVNNLLQQVLLRCEDLVKAALADASLIPGDIDYIIHTGRQSLLPQIRERVRSVFSTLRDDHDLLERDHLKVCVAKGAALYGSMRDRLGAGDARIVFLSEGRRLPHSYGVEKFTDLFEPEFDEVIPRGVKYPVERTKTYDAEMIPSSGTLNLKFYQNVGTSTVIVSNPQVSLIGHISIDTVAKEACDVRIAIGANRTLNVFANDQEVKIEPARLYEEESWMA
ncbi:MAG: molecular chaperone DnaK [Thermoanaerobaculia bacterium]|jgi:molecular chaperone DnaK (HSP70)|nr:molecular chaperone DnaK [Thermoanaerobaculia bacterium]